jgi:segregation and condensation protein A
MTYEVHTRVFEGPLDLLLQLITSHQLEITELSLTDLVAEYLSYLEAIREMDLDVTSEFLLIASTLIQLKARHLLPDDRDIDLDEELALAEERDRLLSRLLACLTFKDVAAVLQHRFAGAARSLPRRVGLDQDIVPAAPELRLAISAQGLALVAERAFRAKRDAVDIDHLDLDLPSVDDAIRDLRVRMQAEIEAEFGDLVAHCERPMEVIAYFLALLELARWGVIKVAQESSNEPIAVKYEADAPPSAQAMASEWSV